MTISGENQRKLLALFEGLTICLPWFLPPPSQPQDGVDSTRMQVLFPPENLKPREDFRRLLSEYKAWISWNRDKGYANFLRASREAASQEDPLWEIRRTLREMGRDSFPLPEGHILKWHLILHLARDFEENRSEAEKMLRELKQQESPLKEALGEDSPLHGLLEDLPVSMTDFYAEERYLSQVIEAWFGLFAGYISDQALITLDQNVFGYCEKIFKDEGGVTSQESEGPLVPEILSNQNITVNYLPLLKQDDERNPFLRDLSGKTIILLTE